ARAPSPPPAGRSAPPPAACRSPCWGRPREPRRPRRRPPPPPRPRPVHRANARRPPASAPLPCRGEIPMLPVAYFPCTQDPPKGEHPDRLIDELVEQAELCEQVGFDGFYFTEHHQQEDAYLPAPVLMAGLEIGRAP